MNGKHLAASIEKVFACSLLQPGQLDTYRMEHLELLDMDGLMEGNTHTQLDLPAGPWLLQIGGPWQRRVIGRALGRAILASARMPRWGSA